jgi:S-adenosylmethionine decarboxylase
LEDFKGDFCFILDVIGRECAMGIGVHLIADFYGCSFEKLNDAEMLLQLFQDAARITGANILDSLLHQFEPFGVTLTVLVSTSHLSLHAWPETGYCSIDLYTCEGESNLPRSALALIRTVLEPKEAVVKEIERGKLLNIYRNDRWTVGEVDILRKHYSGTKDIMDLIPRKTWGAIKNKAKRLGLAKKRPSYKDWTYEEVQFLKENASRFYLTELSVALNRSLDDVRSKVAQEGIEREHFKTMFAHTQLDDFDDINSEQKAYVTGFIAADGNIDKCMNHIRFNQNEQDYFHLARIRDIIDPNSNLHVEAPHKSTLMWDDVAKLEINRRQLCFNLYKHGIVPHKSRIVRPPVTLLPEYERHYIRGYLDGDGSVGLNKNYTTVSALSAEISSGSIFLLEFVRKSVKDHLDVNVNITPNGPIHRVRFSSKKAQKFLRWLYKDATIFLERKYEIAKPFLR